MRVNHREDELENHDRGLDYDLPKLLDRRGLLTLVAGASAVALAGCATAQVATSGATESSSTPDQACGRSRRWWRATARRIRRQQPRGVGARSPRRPPGRIPATAPTAPTC